MDEQRKQHGGFYIGVVKISCFYFTEICNNNFQCVPYYTSFFPSLLYGTKQQTLCLPLAIYFFLSFSLRDRRENAKSKYEKQNIFEHYAEIKPSRTEPGKNSKILSVLWYRPIFLFELKGTSRPTISPFNKAETLDNMFGTREITDLKALISQEFVPEPMTRFALIFAKGLQKF